MSVLLPIEVRPQEQPNWCWAAVAEAVGFYLRVGNPDGALRQCQIVSRVLNRAECCQDGSTEACNCDYYLESALACVGHMYLHPFVGPASFDSIRKVTGPPYNLPIGVRITSGGRGHFLLIIGYNDENGKEWVRVSDPAHGPGSYEIHDFTNSYLGGQWTQTYPIR